ncbi:MAG TPA: prepilin-type N-terminal cleavage/methylation domain-containing protein [Fibrobacteria bacterium]|nr:prepilin-type N-terminal cleavage/methylation domain-containing protein [Fibrobacteria bacterium]
MKRTPRGFTLIEVIVAIVLAVLVVEIAWNMLADQKSNMVGLRQRLRVQAVAREALKSMESEIRIAGFGQRFTFAAGSQGRIDSLSGGGLSECPGIADANGSSVVAMDGAPGQNDTLVVAYPTVVAPNTGTVCSDIRWSRYFVDADLNLVRVVATTQAGLATSTNSNVLAKGVDVFQVRLAVMGGGAAPTQLLSSTEKCCASLLYWSASGATATLSGTSVVVAPNASTTWTFLSASKNLKAGEKWRDTIHIEPNAAYFKDAISLGASLKAGLFTTAGAPVATVDLLTMPATDSALSMVASGLGYGFELVVPTTGVYRLGLRGVSKSTGGTSIRIQTMNAAQVGMAPGTDWWKDPSKMLAADWARVRQVEVIALGRGESMEKKKAVTYTGLANYVQSAGDTGQFKADDKQIRVLFDHVFPVGNNGL